MRKGRSAPGTGDLERAVHDLADAYEAQAEPEERVAAELRGRLGRAATRQVLGTVALTVAMIAAVAVGVRITTAPEVGGPAPMPSLIGLFVTQSPDADGHCHAVRLYDTTAADGRVALWAWSAGGSCAERTDNLSTGLGRASGVLLPSGPGITVKAEAGVPSVLESLELVIEPGGPVTAYPSVQAAVDGNHGIPLQAVEELEITYRPQ